jgi:hypothetical protein
MGLDGKSIRKRENSKNHFQRELIQKKMNIELVS